MSVNAQLLSSSQSNGNNPKTLTQTLAERQRLILQRKLEGAPLSIPEKWIFAAASVLRLSSVSRSFRLRHIAKLKVSPSATGSHLHLANINIPTQTFKTKDESGEYEFDVRDFMLESTALRKQEIRGRLEKPYNLYNSEEREIFCEIALTIPFIKSLSKQIFDNLLPCLQFVIYGPSRVIVVQGAKPLFMYFIISGEVKVYKTVGGIHEATSDMCAGECFGDYALLHNTVRAANVVTKSTCEMFFLSDDDFFRVLLPDMRRELDMKLALMRSLPFLAGMEDIAYAKMANQCTKRSCATNELVLREGEKVHNIFFILSGSVRLVRIVPFAKVAQPGGGFRLGPTRRVLSFRDLISSSRVISSVTSLTSSKGSSEKSGAIAVPASIQEPAPPVFVPLPESNVAAATGTAMTATGNKQTGQQQSVIFKIICVGHLSAGTYFGEDGILGSAAVSRSAKRSHSQHATSTLATYSVITCEPCEILRMSSAEFLAQVPTSGFNLLHMLRSERVEHMSIPFIQESYLRTLQWLNYKSEALALVVLPPDSSWSAPVVQSQKAKHAKIKNKACAGACVRVGTPAKAK